MKILWSCLAALLLASAAYLLRNAQSPLKVPLIRRVKLLDVDAAQAAGAFSWPDALDYTLLIAFPTNTSSPENGELSIKAGQTNILRVSLTSDSLVPCTWLDAFGLKGFIIKMPLSAHNQELSSYLRGGLRYEVGVTNAPPGSSLWLDYRFPSSWNTPFSSQNRAEFRKILPPEPSDK